jgi:signal peptidase I
MESTLSDGNNLIVDKLSYNFKDPERFDIIVFKYQHEENTYYIKRIIGLPGETVQIDKDGNIFVDGSLLEEDYGNEVILNPGLAEEPFILGEDEYFVLGDNRNGSTDSRDPLVGAVSEDWILGRAWVRIWPLSDFEILQHQ